MVRVGILLNEKKCKKLKLDLFMEYCNEEGIEVIQLDEQNLKSLESSLDIIIHKTTNLLPSSPVVSFLERSSSIIIDPPFCILPLLDRFNSYQLTSNLLKDSEFHGKVYVPSFMKTTGNLEEDVNLVQRKFITFPVVCKSPVNHGSPLSHCMCIIFSVNHLGDASSKTDAVIQSFVPHDGLLFKVFVIGRDYFVVQRPSLKNFSSQDLPSIHFDSHSISKPTSTSQLIQNPAIVPPSLDCCILPKVAAHFQSHLHLALFGFDVIVDKCSERFALVDINVFPGYEGVASLHASLLKMIRASLSDEDCNWKVTSSCESDHE